MLSRPLRCRSLYKFNGRNRFWNISEIFLWGWPANWFARAKTLRGVSSIFLLLRLLVIGEVRNCFELIMASWVSSSSLALAKSNLAFSTARAKSLAKWLRIGGGVSKIVLDGWYWRRCSFDSCILDNWKKKRKKLEGFVWRSFSGNHAEILREENEKRGGRERRKRGILVVWCVALGRVMCCFSFWAEK